MLSLIFGVFLIAGIVGIILCEKKGLEMDWLAIAGFVGAIVSLFFLIIVIIGYSSKMVIDDKITLYQTENTEIENSIALIVEDYKKYESETFERFKGNDAVTIATMYPELKSNELVVKQIEIYNENKQRIKLLQTEKLDYKVYGWWLYFEH